MGEEKVTAVGELGSEEAVLRALLIAKQGRLYDLDPGRFPGMPLWPGHPPFQVVTYRSPQGLEAQADQDWLCGERNKIGMGFVSELLIVGCHSGAHMDALAHITRGPKHEWWGGTSADEALGDFGPLKNDASELPVLVTRGIMVDCASFLGRERLPRSYPISLKEFEGAMDAQGTHVEAGDVVLVRTGQMGAWPDTVAWDATRGAGITLPVAEKLIDGGVVAIGGDTEGVEVMPSVEPGNPHPVHIKALIEEGVYLLENLFLEQLSNDKVYEFLFISLAPKIKGATGSFVRPVAII